MRLFDGGKVYALWLVSGAIGKGEGEGGRAAILTGVMPASYRSSNLSRPRDSRHDKIVLWLLEQQATVLAKIREDTKSDWSPVEVVLERPLGRARAAVGFIDLALADRSMKPPIWLNFEVKPEIPVLGDLVRQVQYYRKVLGVNRDGHPTQETLEALQGNWRTPEKDRVADVSLPGEREIFVVASPDDRYRDHLVSQGIRFLRVPREVLGLPESDQEGER